jgi:hypothetical protein
MKVEQKRWMKETGWTPCFSEAPDENVQLVLVFGSRSNLKERKSLDRIREAYPNADILGCSTAGEIFDTQVTDDSIVSTAVSFKKTSVRGVQVRLNQVDNSYNAGKVLAQELPAYIERDKSADCDRLSHVQIFSDGLKVNGSDLVLGLSENLPAGVTVTGGLAGDGAKFDETLVFWNSEPQKDTIVALGFYGNHLKIGFGSLGGWDPFGPERLITRSIGNVLYELDGRSALQLYKEYLGDQALGLPATGLLFPLSLRTKSGETSVVRTILAVDEKEQSMTFAGDMPEGQYARLMKANFDRLIDGAIGAAKESCSSIGSISPDLAILISCVGRKLVLKQRIEEEVEGVRDILGKNTAITGFYSYGEISPFTKGSKCELHNQTMTITTFREEINEPTA